MSVGQMNIAFVEDREDNRQAWLQAMETICDGNAGLRCYGDVETFEQALVSGYIPDVVFVDFFLGTSYGTDVVDLLRTRFGRRVVIIAHSSMPAANEGMVRHGADSALAKIKGDCPSPTVLERFASYAELQDYVCLIRSKG